MLLAVRFAEDSSNIRQNENIADILRHVDDEDMKMLGSNLHAMLGDPNTMQYPQQQQAPRIPHECFTESMASSAIKVAKQMLERAGNVIGLDNAM